MTNQTKVQEVYKIVRYTKNDYGSEISVNEDWNLHLELKSIEDCKTVAKLSGIESFGVFAYDKGHYSSFSDKQVFATKDVLEWQSKLKIQNERKTISLNKAVERVNALPKKVTLYKDEDFLAIGERNNWEPGQYHGSEVHYSLRVLFKGNELGWRQYWRTEGYGKDRRILKKKFAQDVYEKTHESQHNKQGWSEWKQTLKNIPIDVIEKYGNMIEKIYESLDLQNEKIIQAKHGE